MLAPAVAFICSNVLPSTFVALVALVAVAAVVALVAVAAVVALVAVAAVVAFVALVAFGTAPEMWLASIIPVTVPAWVALSALTALVALMALVALTALVASSAWRAAGAVGVPRRSRPAPVTVCCLSLIPATEWFSIFEPLI